LVQVTFICLIGDFCGTSKDQKYLVGDANDTAGRARAGVAGLQRLLVTALAKIIRAAVDDNSAADDALGANQLDEAVRNGALGVALGVGLDVAQVADVTGVIGRGTVSLAVGVEVRASGGAAVGVVTEGVDVETALGVRVVAGQVVSDNGGGRLGGLLEGNGTRHLGVTADNSNSLDHFDEFVKWN